MNARSSLVARESWPARLVVVARALGFLGFGLLVPVASVFASAFSGGWGRYWSALGQTETLSAIRLTLIVAAISVPLNVVFGIAAAWLIAKFDFRGRGVLTTLIDLPFTVSPVISGLVFVLLFGAHGWLGPLLEPWGLKIIFAVPGLVLATAFVTVPLVAREVLAVMQSTGSDEEETALTLGATGWQILWRVTLPKVRWGVLYGAVLCNARAMGEFGAASVVSGHIRGHTNTMPLHIEILYSEYEFVAAFAVATLLTLLAVLTLALKKGVELWARSAE